MNLKTPKTIVEHSQRYKNDAWKQYTPIELGMWVHLLVTRAGHRSEPEKIAKDLTDAQNYSEMLKAHIEDARSRLLS